jgi:hypothetical protein
MAQRVTLYDKEFANAAVGIVGQDSKGSAVIIGGIATSSANMARSDGTIVSLYVDNIGRLVTSGFNSSLGSMSVSDVAPQLAQTFESALLSAVTTTGASVSVNAIQYSKHTFHIIATSVNTQGIMQIQTALDTANWVTQSIVTITSAGNSEVALTAKAKFVRANLVTRSDGTYTVNYLGGY